MSIDTIEKKYKELSIEEKDLGETLLKLIDIVRDILKLLTKTEGKIELREETNKLLKSLMKEKKEDISRDKLNNYLTSVKNILSKMKHGDKMDKEEKKDEYSDLIDDLNIIHQILEEELPKDIVVSEKTVVPPVEPDIKELTEELREIKEYIKILSDKLFDLGEEILDIKERVLRLEEERAFEEEVLSEDALFLKNLITEAKDTLTNIKENIIARALKVEALKIRMDKNKNLVQKVPKKIREDFEKIYARLLETSKTLREKIKQTYQAAAI